MEPALRRRRRHLLARYLLTGAFVLALGACTGSPPPPFRTGDRRVS